MAELEQAQGPTTVAIVDDDERLVAALVRDLGTRGLEVHTAQSAQQALKLLEEHNVDVMLTDLRMSGRDGIDLIRAVGILSPNTRSILMSAFATAKDYKVAMELGAVEVLGKPFTPDELHAALEKAIGRDGSVRGDMQGISLTDVLSLFHSGKRSITIRLGGSSSAIHMREGEIVHAEHGRLTGREALLSLLSAPLGRVRTGNLESSSQSIDQPFQSLLDEIVATLAKHQTGRYSRELSVAGTENHKQRNEVAKMTGPTNKPTPSGSGVRAQGSSSNRGKPMMIGGVVLVAVGLLLLALGIQRGNDVDSGTAEPTEMAVNEINIDITEYVKKPEPPKPEPTQVAQEPTPEPAVEPEAAVEPPKAVASRKATRSSSKRRKRAARRSTPPPKPVVEVTPAPVVPEPVAAAPASVRPRKPDIGTIAAKQPAIGVVRSGKPVIGTVEGQ